MQEELIKYFDDSGVTKAWFSRQLGICYSWFWSLLKGHKAINADLALEIERLTNGKVTAITIAKRNPE